MPSVTDKPSAPPGPEWRATSPAWSDLDEAGHLRTETGRFPAVSDAARILEATDNLEKERIVDALAKCNGNQTRAAQMLGISRRVLINRILRYDLPRPRAPQRGDASE